MRCSVGRRRYWPRGSRLKSPPISQGVPADLEFIQGLGHGGDLSGQGFVRLGGPFQVGVEHCQLTAAAQRQIAHQQGIFRLELTADDVGVGHRQLYPFGMVDAVATQGRQLPADAAEDVRIGDEIGLPVEGTGAARIEVGQPLLQQLELVLVIAGLGALVQFLEQHDVWLLVADDPCHFVEAEGHVFQGRAFIVALGQVVPEHVAFAGEELDVPGHHLQGLAGRQRCCVGGATDRQGFPGLWPPGQAVDRQGGQAEDQQQAQQGVAQ